MENRYVNKNLNQLQDEASIALMKLLEAQDTQADENSIEKLQIDYAIKQNNLEEYIKNKSSTSLVNSILSQHPVKSISQTFAKPQFEFSTEDSISIKKHFENLPPDLQALFNAALEDSNISLDTINNPVFLKGEGYVYDLSEIQKLLNKNANYPRNLDRKVTQKDIIPCNTLISAMFQMLNIIKGNISITRPVEVNTYMLEASKNDQDNISNEMIQMIEQYYVKGIEDKHRILFDIICRDSYTQMIMQRPCFLPDGYVYDRSTVSMLLESARSCGQDSAMCPKMNIPFKEEDITPSPMVIAVLEQLKSNIQSRIDSMQSSHHSEMNVYKPNF